MSKDTIYRQDAIDALDVLCQEHRYKIPGKIETYSQYNEAWQDALDRAEGAIGNLPSAQPETHEKRTETHACDLISRQEAIEVLAKFVPYAICDASTESYTNGLTDAYNLICQLPSAQPEEDCDTCKHGYFMDAQCERCRVRYPSHYEREVEHHGSD